MIDELVKSIISKMKTEYPQLEVPGAMRAVIVSAKKSGERYQRTIYLTDKTSNYKREYVLEEDYYIYSVKIIDNDGNPLSKYPIIPEIKSRTEYQTGNQVTVVFTDGGLTAAIIG